MKWERIPLLVVFVIAVQTAVCLSRDGPLDAAPAPPSVSGSPQPSIAAPTLCDECPPDPKVTALCLACEGDLQEVQRLLREIRIPNVTCAGTSPLCVAANHRLPAIVQALLNAKADPNYRPVLAQGVYGSPPLVWAARCDPSEPFQSCEAVVKILLAGGAEINQGDSDGYTPLMAASSVGNLEMVTLLIKKGAHLNAETRTKHNALFYARENGHLDIVTALLELGAKE